MAKRDKYSRQKVYGLISVIFCRVPLSRFPALEFEAAEKLLFVQLSLCEQCGWWSVYRVHQGHSPRTPEIEAYSGSIGCLKELDVTDITTPLDEVRQYFLAKQDSIFEAHPRLFEEVVCSIFKDQGWQARVTAYSGDDGIDVILDGPSDSTVGVQVKRYSKERRIEAEQIRSLAGALVLNGHTEGVFVTTSSFRRGAIDTARRFSNGGYPIRLIDADKFIEALGIAQREKFSLSPEQVQSYLLCYGVHLGSGIVKEFTRGENLLERRVIASIWLVSDLLDAEDDEDQADTDPVAISL